MAKNKEVKKLTLEEYVLQLLNQKIAQLHTLNVEKEDYTEKDYQFLWTSYISSINVLYMCLASQK